MHGEQIVDALRVALADDRDAERLRPGRNRQRRAARAAAPEHGGALAVHGDLDFLVAAERLEAEAVAAAADANLVLGVERKDVPNAHAAARAERLAVQVLGLREPARRRDRS